MKYEVSFIHLPVKMEPIVSSETSAIKSQTPGNYPKRNKLQRKHDLHHFAFRTVTGQLLPFFETRMNCRVSINCVRYLYQLPALTFEYFG